MKVDLSSRVALITGAGRGIGKTIAAKLAANGCAIVATDVSDISPTVAEIEALGGTVISVQGDVSNAQDVGRVVDTAIQRFGKIDILVNNAGITRDKLILRMTDEDWDRVIGVNLKGAFLYSRAVLRYMIKQRWGRIINMSSVSGVIGNPGQANYSSSKAGLIGLTKTIAKEVASRGITANAIAPGFIDTDMTKKLNEKVREAVAKQIPLGFFGLPEDVANTVLFLASEESRYITGNVIRVDGGIAMVA